MISSPWRIGAFRFHSSTLWADTALRPSRGRGTSTSALYSTDFDIGSLAKDVFFSGLTSGAVAGIESASNGWNFWHNKPLLLPSIEITAEGIPAIGQEFALPGTGEVTQVPVGILKKGGSAWADVSKFQNEVSYSMMVGQHAFVNHPVTQMVVDLTTTVIPIGGALKIVGRATGKTFLKASSKILGTAQMTGTRGHAFLSKAVAHRYALDPRVSRVTMDLGYRKLLGSAAPKALRYGPRPDVGVLFKSGKFKVFEIASKSDKLANLASKNEKFIRDWGFRGVGSQKVISGARYINKLWPK